MIRRVGCIALLVCVLDAAAAFAGDGVGFRGPNGLGTSAETGLPTTWSDTENVVWRTELPGPGGSSPIVVAGKIYLTCYTGYGMDSLGGGDPAGLVRHLVCLERATGRIAWTRDVPALQPEEPYDSFQALHGFASSSPASDGRRVFAFFGKSGVHALDLDGNPLWQADVGSGVHDWGSGSSPVLDGDLVIVNAGVESGKLIALDAGTGELRWQAEGVRGAWNTPLVVPVADGSREIVLTVPPHVRGFSPGTGEELWRCAGIEDRYVCSSPVADSGIVYAIEGRGNPGLAVRAGGRGDVTASHRLWQTSQGSNVSSPVFHQGYLYFAHESQGIALCVNAADGEAVYERRLEPRPDRIYASAFLADGKIYYVSRNNGTFVVAAKPEFELLAHNQFESDTSVFNATPIADAGQLLLRSDRYFYCLDALAP